MTSTTKSIQNRHTAINNCYKRALHRARTTMTTRTPLNTASAERSRTYITHLVEFDYPERFVSEQAGHRYASTTAIYTNPRELHQTGAFALVA